MGNLTQLRGTPKSAARPVRISATAIMRMSARRFQRPGTAAVPTSKSTRHPSSSTTASGWGTGVGTGVATAVGDPVGAAGGSFVGCGGASSRAGGKYAPSSAGTAIRGKGVVDKPCRGIARVTNRARVVLQLAVEAVARPDGKVVMRQRCHPRSSLPTITSGRARVRCRATQPLADTRRCHCDP